MGELKSWFQNLRRLMLEEREREVQYLLKIQSYRNSFLDWYFFFASNLGEEFFYITFLPFSTWTLGNKEAAHFVILMLFFCVGLGNWLKNIFLIPRPPHPRVWTPENKQKSDHGFPSTHTISFVGAPIYFMLYQYHDKVYRVQSYPLSFGTAAFLTFILAASVIFSRLYNGYHSPLDVGGGAIIGLITVTSWYISIRYWYDTFLMWNSFYAPMLALVIGASMVVLHPRPNEPTAALPESGMLFGSAAGTTIGVQFGGLIDYASILGVAPRVTFPFLLEPVTLQITRFIVGILIVAILRDINKKMFTGLVRKFYPDEKDSNWVTTNVKFLNYLVISFAITSWIQIVFHLLGLQTDYDLRPVTAFPTGFPN